MKLDISSNEKGLPSIVCVDDKGICHEVECDSFDIRVIHKAAAEITVKFTVSRSTSK